MTLGGARRGFVKPWSNPYQTPDNALVAMWDGEWNAVGEDGLPYHDPNAIAWTEVLTAADYAFSEGSPTWGARCLQTSSDGAYIEKTLPFQIGPDRDWTFECGYINNAANNNSANAVNIGAYAAGVSHFYTPYYSRVSLDRQNKAFASQLTPGIRHIVSGVINGNTAVRYIDGEAVDTAEIVRYTGSGNIFRVNGLYEKSYRMNGEVNFVRIYNRALTAAEVAARYALDVSRFTLPTA